jgi:redox-sensitive bicupin YhaK (pirin superfamily)
MNAKQGQGDDMKNSYFIRQAQETSEGDSVDVKRLFPIPSCMNFDPFVLWDHFNVKPGSGFPDHPHRGFEGITYMFSGTMEHKDNLGNQSRVGAGGAQLFTAGQGIVHSEMPGSQGDNEGIQLWVNLPRSLKGLEPDYQQVEQHDFPLTEFSTGSIRTIAGEGSPLRVKTACVYRHLQLEAGGEYAEQVPEGFRGFIYMVEGQANVEDQELHAGDALFAEESGLIKFRSKNGCVAMLCFGMPHREPIHQHGPYVD